MSYFPLFLQTLLIELLFLLLFFWKQDKGRVLLCVTLANALTHPWVVFGWVAFPKVNLFWALIGAEVFAIGVEAFIYYKVLKIHFIIAFLGSFFANLLSWELGPRLSFALRNFYS